MNISELVLKERELLKAELQSLKSCQVQYFSFGITATGVIFGLAEKSSTQSPGVIYLIPILILVPLWSVFFDKAASVTRIVGYIRILERILIDEKAYIYIGWENALKNYRNEEESSRAAILVEPFVVAIRAFSAIWLLVDFRRKHRYWAINWMSFFGLGLCSLYMAHLRGVEREYLWLFGAVFTVASIHNAEVLWCLVWGQYEYDRREQSWSKMLRQVDTNQALVPNPVSVASAAGAPVAPDAGSADL